MRFLKNERCDVTVRKALLTLPNASYDEARIWNADALAALDTIASELERLRIAVANPPVEPWSSTRLTYAQAVERATARAEAAEAELERVRAERDRLQAVGDDPVQYFEVQANELRDTRARLDRAVEALREILERPHGELDEHEMRSVAHAALAEIEASA